MQASIKYIYRFRKYIKYRTQKTPKSKLAPSKKFTYFCGRIFL